MRPCDVPCLTREKDSTNWWSFFLRGRHCCWLSWLSSEVSTRHHGQQIDMFRWLEPPKRQRYKIFFGTSNSNGRLSSRALSLLKSSLAGWCLEPCFPGYPLPSIHFSPQHLLFIPVGPYLWLKPPGTWVVDSDVNSRQRLDSRIRQLHYSRFCRFNSYHTF